jgi:threonylcarbamoyladenosine tRNA methylthiotransferase MtaB
MPPTMSQQPEVVSLGCRLNAAEASAIRSYAVAAGLGDAVILNTCAVTAEAVSQAGQAIRRVRRERPGARIVVTGCAAQIDPARFAAMAEVDHVIGNAEKTKVETYQTLADVERRPARVLVGDIMQARVVGHGQAGAMTTPARAFVEVQNGCDHRCTFCVIPYGRGPSRSVPAAEVVGRVRAMIERGAPEVVLTGVDLTSWGRDLGDAGSLGRLVRQILREVPELARLRLSSIDQAEADAELMTCLAEEERLMPHLHLSLQSGSDLILKRMKRRHSRADAISFCAEARRLRPDIAIGADLIAGFATESPVHAADTISLVDECGLSFLHVFPFSPRAGTPAARMPQVPVEVVRERAARLREKGQQVLGAWMAGQVGQRIEMALEQTSRADSAARTPQFALASVRGIAAGRGAGETIAAVVMGHDGRRLLAEAVV